LEIIGAGKDYLVKCSLFRFYKVFRYQKSSIIFDFRHIQYRLANKFAFQTDTAFIALQEKSGKKCAQILYKQLKF
jgi:hypothetical protein